jgi:dihydrofolate reductase
VRTLAKVRVSSFGVSLDGFSAGVDQGPEQPLGKGGPTLFEWFFDTRTWREMHGMEGGSRGLDDEFAAKAMANVGAWILGRNMFGPVRGPWPDDSWKGWWGEEPPYHVAVFVLTHYARDPVEMKGGTTFHFVTGGIHEALERARDASGERDVRIGGGAATIRQYLTAGLVDEMHLVYAPVLLGAGESLLAGLDLTNLGFRVRRNTNSERCMHVEFAKA